MNRDANAGNLTRRMVEALGVAVVTGRYGPATPFPIEADLCTQFGASRSIVREAVKMLTAKGLLTSRPRRGTVVEPEDNWNLLDPDVMRWLLERKFSLGLLAEFIEMRLAIEPMAAVLAARRGDRDAIARIGAAIDRMKAAEYGDDDPLASDIAFHVAVLEASGNRFYAQLRDLIDTALRISIRTTNEYKGVTQASVADHVRVLDAIAAGDADAAGAAMRELIEEAMGLIDAARSRRKAAREASAAASADPDRPAA